MKVRTALCATVLVLAGCGGTKAVQTAASATTTTPVATAVTDGVRVNTDPTTTTAVPADLAAKLADVKLRGKVRSALQGFWQKYDYLIAATGGNAAPEDSDIDKAISDACTGQDEAAGDVTGAIALYAGETLKAHGTDAVGFMGDVRALNDKVIGLAHC